jgi:hypothetical protein
LHFPLGYNTIWIENIHKLLDNTSCEQVGQSFTTKIYLQLEREKMKRAISFALVILMFLVFALPSSSMSGTQALAAAGDHFRPSSPTPLGAADDNLRTPADFEAAVAAQPSPTGQVLVSRCRFTPFNGNTSFYSAISGGVSDAIVGDTTFSFADGTQCFNPQNESNIVVNPTDSQNVVTSANEYRIDGAEVYVSFDGGASWQNVVVTGRTGATGGKGLFARLSDCGDPVLAFGPDGTLYYAGLVCSQNLVAFYSGVTVSASHDGGLTWNAPRMVAFTNSPTIFHDKEWITVGANGTIYVTWTRFKANGSNPYVASPIVLSSSTDGGVTWSDWVPVSDPSHPYDQGSVPLVAPDGTLYVAYEGSTPASGYAADAIILARSTDGGKTFTNAELARAYDDYNCYPINIAQERQTLSGEEFRINSFPSFAIDPSNGQMAITWADDQANASCGYEKGGSFVGPTSNQVKLITSTDGLTWSAPLVITTGAADKVYPAVGANAGRIFVSYYTRAYSPSTADCQAMYQDTTNGTLSTSGGPVCLDYASRSSSDGFANETRLTNQPSNPYITFAGSFIGDYTGAVITSGGSALGVWADFRGNPGITDPNMDVDVAWGK